MPRFNSPRDVNLFKHFSSELVDDVIETAITFFKLNVEDTSFNLYGESLSKQYYLPISTFCIIERTDTEANYEGFGPDAMRTSNFRFNRHTLETADFYPQIGDIISLNESYYEVSNVREDQWIGGLDYNKFSIICETFMARKSSLDLQDIVR